MAPRFLRARIGLALLLAGTLASCGGEGPASATNGGLGTYPSPPCVLLITVDTLRADHLSCYGYFRETSPRIDALAAEGLRFSRAYSTSATTLPSHLSIMTGLYPHQHGFVANKGAIPGSFQPSEGRTPVAQFFRRSGYETAAFVSGATVKRTTGIQHGFVTWSQPEIMHREGVETNGDALAWIDEYARGDRESPFFLWVHYWDTHEPNDPPEPYRSMFAAGDDLEALLEKRRVDHRVLEDEFTPTEIARLFYPELLEEMLREERDEVPPLDHSSLLTLYGRYDGDVRYVDDRVGELLDRLRDHGLYDQSIIALTSDHGQALGQHDWLEHGRIQTPNTNVPLILRLPPPLQPEPAVLDQVVSLVDLMPTVMARVDSPLSATFLRQAWGQDLLGGSPPRGYAFSHRAEKDRNWEPGRKFGLTIGRWRYYHLEEGPDQLFDLEADPGELVDVAATHGEEVAKLRRIVKRLLAESPEGEVQRGQLSPEEQEQLDDELFQTGYLDRPDDELDSGR